MTSLNISGRQMAVGRSDVVVSNIGLANEFLRDSQSMINEFRRVTGVSLELTDIEFDPFGRIIISKPELAKFLKAGKDTMLIDELAASNGICGLRCS